MQHLCITGRLDFRTGTRQRMSKVPQVNGLVATEMDALIGTDVV
jgi:hypothetical protein